MSSLIKLYNPSGYSRKDNVILPWQSLNEAKNLDIGHFTIRDDGGNDLPYQVDVIDPSDRSLDMLIIGILNEIPPGPEDYSHASSCLKIEEHNPCQNRKAPESLKLEVKKDDHGVERGLIFCNERLNIFFNLVPEKDYEWEEWYSGSATSVLLDGKEIMDIGDWLYHDKEKRCMQIDKITIPSAPWDKAPDNNIHIYNKSYRIISINDNRPNRVSVTIATEPFDYVFVNPLDGSQSCVPVSLYRIISLGRYADYVNEKIFIKPCHSDFNSKLKKILLRFKARYFSYINIGYNTKIYYFSGVPDWFAIGNNEFPPYNGYGFATDVHNETVINPHPNFPNATNAYNSYSWLTGEGREINCIHHFSHYEPFKFDDKSGRTWYEKVYKPLKAEYENGE